MKKLQPCKVCGSEACATYNFTHGFQVFCANDECPLKWFIMKGMKTEKQAIKAWNKMSK